MTSSFKVAVAINEFIVVLATIKVKAHFEMSELAEWHRF